MILSRRPRPTAAGESYLEEMRRGAQPESARSRGGDGFDQIRIERLGSRSLHGYNAAGHGARQLQARVGGPARHVRQHVSLLGVCLARFGPIIGTFALGPLMDRIERRTTPVLFALMLVSAIGFIALPRAVLLVRVLLVWMGPPGSMGKALE
jgi:hypothetical protein